MNLNFYQHPITYPIRLEIITAWLSSRIARAYVRSIYAFNKSAHFYFGTHRIKANVFFDCTDSHNLRQCFSLKTLACLNIRDDLFYFPSLLNPRKNQRSLGIDGNSIKEYSRRTNKSAKKACLSTATVPMHKLTGTAGGLKFLLLVQEVDWTF